MSTWDRLAPSLRASSPGHTGLGKRGPPVVFGSYKGQMLQNNDQQSQGLTRRFVLSAKKTTHLFQMYFSSSSQNLTTNFEFLVVFGSFKAQMLQNNDQQALCFVFKKDNTLFIIGKL